MLSPFIYKRFIRDLSKQAVLFFYLPSMNRLNQTEPATFSVLLCWAFFKGTISFYISLRIICQDARSNRKCQIKSSSDHQSLKGNKKLNLITSNYIMLCQSLINIRNIFILRLNGTYIDDPISCVLSFSQEDNEE